MAETQFITNKRGERVGVILDLPTYHQLISEDSELLTNLSEAELTALANSKLSLDEQAQLDALLDKQTREVLTETESLSLDALVEQVDLLNVLKARAKYTLQMQSSRG